VILDLIKKLVIHSFSNTIRGSEQGALHPWNVLRNGRTVIIRILFRIYFKCIDLMLGDIRLECQVL
jgi:hypothetical protein